MDFLYEAAIDEMTHKSEEQPQFMICPHLIQGDLKVRIGSSVRIEEAASIRSDLISSRSY